MKYDKENYVQPDADMNSEFWANNIGAVLLKQYHPVMKGRVVDFGCNNGLWAAFVSRNPQVTEVVGFDLNRESLKVGYDEILPQVPDTRHKVTLHEANLVDLKWTGQLFDFAYSFHTLEHIFPEDVDAVMTNMSALLKSDGLFLMNLPDKYSYYWEALHVYHPNLLELDALFEKYGYDKLESYVDERGGQHDYSKNITGLYRKR